MTLYKVTDEDGKPCHGGSGAWPLPKNGKPGAKWEVTGDLEPCENGLHLCKTEHLVDWLGPVIWEAEAFGEQIDHGNKIVAREGRLIRRCDGWNEQTARLFAADCAERVLKIANDKRCDEAVLAARQYACGFIDDEKLEKAASAASAAWAARAARGACYAASAAAWDASAASAASAAWAARAAWAATSAATKAAWDARAAWDAAWDASATEREWQTDRLMQYINGEVDLESIRNSVEPKQ